MVQADFGRIVSSTESTAPGFSTEVATTVTGVFSVTVFAVTLPLLLMLAASVEVVNSPSSPTSRQVTFWLEALRFL